MESRYISNIDFARQAKVLNGELPLSQLQRLSEGLAKDAPIPKDVCVKFSLVGHANRFHLPSLHLDIEANLPMDCQRCLEAIEIPISLHFDYLIGEESVASSEDNDELDWLEPSDKMDLNELIEDELLIALPIAPVHSNSCKQLNLQSGDKLNPFAVLKALKKD